MRSRLADRSPIKIKLLIYYLFPQKMSCDEIFAFHHSSFNNYSVKIASNLSGVYLFLVPVVLCLFFCYYTLLYQLG